MIEFQGHPITEIYFSEEQRNKLIAHCLRKLNREYLPGENPEPKAYGLIGGELVGRALSVEMVAPLCKNSREIGLEKEYMDKVLDQYALPSETPLAKRGWVTDPIETINILKEFQKKGVELIGTYHMHRVSWQGDKNREKPTELDTVLAKDTELLMFIISVIDPEKPVIRAFYEGYPDREVPIYL